MLGREGIGEIVGFGTGVKVGLGKEGKWNVGKLKVGKEKKGLGGGGGLEGPASRFAM